ncbi:MAG: hypothetical protein MZV70_13920 [Desulfobacterales bacterium]|nr:hypothetical protein [Desulfobacterales bacterium]
MAIHSVTIKNASNYDVKDIVVRFGYASDSGTTLGTHLFTIYKVLPKGKTKTFSNLNAGFIHPQATKSGVDEIVSVEIAVK